MATILVIDDNETLREGVAAVCKKMGHPVLTAESGATGLQLFDRNAIDLVITDLKMEPMDGIQVLRAVKERNPDVAVIVMTAFGTIEGAVEAMQLGAVNFLTKEKFSPEHVRVHVDRALEWRAMREENARLSATARVLSRPDVVPMGRTFFGMVGESKAIRDVFSKIERLAQSDANVHIAGESGTGKELVAQAIHDLSRRAGGPFIKVNCGAIPETLIESELFGHERGAFTGAVKRKLGRFELAHQGTILLDEVGELSLAMQVKLLRVLQEREFERVGGEKPIRVDVRVLSATHRNLKAEVDAGRFREDLFYRLHIVPLLLPPLRERTDDIVVLARHFVEKLRRRTNPEVTSIDADAEAQLVTYHYPGNVRELENIIEQALVFAEPPSIRAKDLPQQIFRGVVSQPVAEPPTGALGLDEFLEAAERQLILRAYNASGGVKTETARRLKIKTGALYYKLEKYGIGTVAGRRSPDDADHEDAALPSADADELK